MKTGDSRPTPTLSPLNLPTSQPTDFPTSKAVFLLAVLLLFSPDPPALAAAAEAALAARFPEAAVTVEVRRTGGTVPAAPRLEFETLPRGAHQVDLLDADGHRTGWALLHVAHFDSVLVPVERLVREAPVPASALRAEWTETTRFAGEPLRPADFRALGGEAVAVRGLAAGRPLRAGDLRGPLAAEPGEPIALTYRRGAITLGMACRAREGGAVGETVRLVCPETGALVRARLTAPAAADWLETLQRRD